MPSKLQTYMQMADEAQRQITGSYRGWTGFLTTAARLYKYPYAEQVMIHAQRPDATACAEYDFWNKKMGRYVRRGSKGIALIDSSGERPRLRYVFDVSDTGGREFPKSRYLWEYREEHADAVSAMLESRYGVDGKGGLPNQLERIASQLAEEYWRDYKRDILAIVDDSFLYGYDEFNVGAAFQSAAAVSIAYSLMSRCGLEADDRFEHEDFLSIFDFNTPEAAAELGTAVSRINGEVLRQIEVTIKNYEREKLAERSRNHDRTDLHQERGLPDSRPDAERNAGGRETPGQVRETAQELPSGAQTGAVQPSGAVGEAVPASAGDRRDGEPEAGADDAGADEVGGRDGGAESPRPDEMGGADEQPETGLISLVVLPVNFWLNIYDGIFLGWWNEIPSIFSFGGFNLVPTIIKALSGEIVIGSWVKTMLIGNVAMLLPLGFFLPFVTEKVNKKNIYSVAVVVPSIAELLQMIFGRSLDVDDLICNFIGIVAGFFVGLAIRNIKGKNKTINEMPTTRSLPKTVEKQKEKSS